MKPEDVPDELVEAFALAYIATLDRDEDNPVRAALAAVLPGHEQQIRAEVADEILAAKGTDPRFPNGWASEADRDHAARIARGEA